MTSDDRLERILGELLADAAPPRAPDRLRQDVLTTTSHIRPRPRWLVIPTLSLRFHFMSSSIKIAAAATLAIAVGMGVAPFLRPSVQGPTPSPSPSPSFGPIPAEIQNEFVGDARTVRGIPGTATDRARAIKLTGADLSFFHPWESGRPSTLTSRARASLDGQLELTTVRAGFGCAAGDVGHYAYRFGPAELALTIESGDDACATRADALPGTWVGLGAGCDGGQWCLGTLPAGSHATSWFTPRGAGGDSYRLRLGQLTYSVPVDWRNTWDDQNEVVLEPTTNVGAAPVLSDHVFPDQVRVEAHPVALAADSLCAGKADPSVGTSMAELVAFIEGHPGVVVKDSQRITLDGHPAHQLDIDVSPTWTAACPDSTDFVSFVPLLGDGRSLAADGTVTDSWWLGIGAAPGSQASSPVRLILADLGGGDVVAIFMAAYQPADQPAFVAEAMPVVESFHFAD